MEVKCKLILRMRQSCEEREFQAEGRADAKALRQERDQQVASMERGPGS